MKSIKVDWDVPCVWDVSGAFQCVGVEFPYTLKVVGGVGEVSHVCSQINPCGFR